MRLDSGGACPPGDEEVEVTRRVFLDTEFIEDGVTIDLVSIALVDDQGRDFYAISTEFNPAAANVWVRENVLAKLPWERRAERGGPWRSRTEIAAGVLAFLAPTDNWDDLELWAYYGAYDHVALAQLWGPMIDLPKGVPMFTHELMQLWEDAGRPPKPPQPRDAHDALADARWNRALWTVCMTQGV